MSNDSIIPLRNYDKDNNNLLLIFNFLTEEKLCDVAASWLCAREAELCQICQGDPQRAFSEILQSWDQGKLLQKEGQKKHPGANAIMS